MWDLDPQPGIKPVPLALEVQNLKDWTGEKSQLRPFESVIFVGKGRVDFQLS